MIATSNKHVNMRKKILECELAHLFNFIGISGVILQEDEKFHKHLQLIRDLNSLLDFTIDSNLAEKVTNMINEVILCD
jgi:hypothetical protein